MGFGVVIASGTNNAVWRPALMECLIEARIEQTLDEPTRFGLRIREDFIDGAPMAAGAPELKAESMVTIAVPRGDALVCLVRGPITDTQAHYTLGGPGSYHEVHGGDRRVELARDCFQHAWEGRASDAARSIIEGYGFEADVQDTEHRYTSRTQTLNQRGTDLDFLKTAARENGFFFWISYEARTSGTAPSASVRVTDKGHFRTSPFRSLGAGGVPPSIATVVLAPTGGPKIRAGAGGDCGSNVTSFEVREDVERPNAASFTAVDETSLNRDRSSTSDPQDPVASGGRRLADVTGLRRTLCVTAPGNAQQVGRRAEAALADAGWFLSIKASTTAHMLKGIVQPHDVVEIEGIGKRHSIACRVKKVTHVITATDHYMDVELQSNAHKGDT